MDFFNAALVPCNGVYTKRLTEYCQSNLSHQADGYCLSDKVLPHITLCQFRADKLPDFLYDFNYTPQNPRFNKRQGYGRHEGYNWFEIVIEKDGLIIAMQAQVNDALNANGLESTTAIGKGYAPHITLCRYKESLDVNYDETLLAFPPNWKFELGRSDENGQYLGKVWNSF